MSGQAEPKGLRVATQLARVLLRPFAAAAIPLVESLGWTEIATGLPELAWTSCDQASKTALAAISTRWRPGKTARVPALAMDIPSTLITPEALGATSLTTAGVMPTFQAG